MSVRSDPVYSDPTETALAEAVLAAYGGDARAALAAILMDARFYHDQLLFASTFISRGASRGWAPKFERD